MTDQTITVDQKLTAFLDGDVLTLDQLRTVVVAARSWPAAAVVTSGTDLQGQKFIEIRHATAVEVL